MTKQKLTSAKGANVASGENIIVRSTALPGKLPKSLSPLASYALRYASHYGLRPQFCGDRLVSLNMPSFAKLRQLLGDAAECGIRLTINSLAELWLFIPRSYRYLAMDTPASQVWVYKAMPSFSLAYGPYGVPHYYWATYRKDRKIATSLLDHIPDKMLGYPLIKRLNPLKLYER